jgi:hypothetical protein
MSAGGRTESKTPDEVMFVFKLWDNDLQRIKWLSIGIEPRTVKLRTEKPRKGRETIRFLKHENHQVHFN